MPGKHVRFSYTNDAGVLYSEEHGVVVSPKLMNLSLPLNDTTRNSGKKAEQAVTFIKTRSALDISPFHQSPYPAFCLGHSSEHIFDYMRANPSTFQRISLMQNLASGLQFLHSKNTLHRNICAPNILIDGDGKAVLADFRPNISMVESDPPLAMSRYEAPECAMSMTGNDYSVNSDIWSLACVYAYILRGKHPFAEASSFPAIIMAMYKKSMPFDLAEPSSDSVDQEVWDIICGCFKYCSQSRPRLEDIRKALHDIVDPAVVQTDIFRCRL